MKKSIFAFFALLTLILPTFASGWGKQTERQLLKRDLTEIKRLLQASEHSPPLWLRETTYSTLDARDLATVRRELADIARKLRKKSSPTSMQAVGGISTAPKIHQAVVNEQKRVRLQSSTKLQSAKGL